MRLLYVMDPLERISPTKDTTYAFLRAAEARGHENFHCEVRDVFARGGEVFARTRRAHGFVAENLPPYRLDVETSVQSVGAFDAVLIRKDPPFDAAYLYLTHLLDRAPEGTLVLNRPQGLRDANEKLYALHFAELMPRTLVAADPAQILAFAEEVGGQAVIKPLDGAGGAGVLLLRTDDKNARGIIDMLTAEGQKLAMAQAFLPAVSQGDKRVLLLNGRVLGAINRVARGDDFRSNIHVGGRVEPVEVSARERQVIEAIAPKLVRDGLVFVGLDFIGEHLTEVNVTSPTGIQELSQHLQRDVAAEVIEWIEQAARRF